MNDATFADIQLTNVPRTAGFPVLGPAIIYGRIGEGASSTIYLATHAASAADVAVKVLKENVSAPVTERFRREARLTARFEHPAFVHLLGQGVDRQSGTRFMVLEFVPGESLLDRVSRRGPMDLGEAITAVRAVSEGLGELHRKGLVHRDVKPSNILVSHQGELKIADLGVAKAVESSGDPVAVDDLTISGEVLGSESYMPPEQRHSSREVGAPADVYALGGVLLFLVTGKTPAKALASADLPASISAWVKRCRSRDPSARFEDAGAAAAALVESSAGIAELSLADPALQDSLREWYRLRPSEEALRRVREEAPQALEDFTQPSDFKVMSRQTRVLLLVLAAALAIALGIVAGID